MLENFCICSHFSSDIFVGHWLIFYDIFSISISILKVISDNTRTKYVVQTYFIIFAPVSSNSRILKSFTWKFIFRSVTSLTSFYHVFLNMCFFFSRLENIFVFLYNAPFVFRSINRENSPTRFKRDFIFFFF